ncbi:Crp/Fnr family transcriptional regulator [Mucilaginibacter corticis]|uniref:Crp/Fnr family transcriptional regulator n=1 Tax=Mucilaginibacter corticis TaxID=2597670 RepID=A0A556MS56_9SPHI|nr:Crp/Fnr family transcriptional regulator [Mucilaginibacter corticis]TSJ42628.1 Crp/Fnr family transcriptional regulator [Mucilaginibacter corticis]
MWQLLYLHIEKMGVVLDNDEKAILQDLFKPKKFRKGQYILQQGDVVKYETIVTKGLTRTYSVSDKGQEHVIGFGPEEWWVGDLYSLFTGEPSAYNIDCLEETDVLQITRTGLDELCLRVPKMNIYYRDLYRNSVIAFNKRLHATLEKTAPERYAEFQEKYPQIEQRVPNHQIAAFLGITPQSLSRIRRQLVSPKD